MARTREGSCESWLVSDGDGALLVGRCSWCWSLVLRLVLVLEVMYRARLNVKVKGGL